MPDVIDYKIDDDEEDLDALPRGDDLDADETPAKESEKPRGKDGKFVAPKEESEEESEEASEEETEEGTEDAEDDDAPAAGKDDDAPAAGKDVKTLEAGRAKALKQRDEARERLRQMEVDLAVARAGSAKKEDAPASDPVAEINTQLDALYAQVEEFRADADTANAAKAQREIDRLNRTLTTMESVTTAGRLNAKQMDDIKFDAYYDIIVAARPDVDKESDEYDPAVAKEFGLLLKAYEGTGMGGAAALRKASTLLLQLDPKNPVVAKESDSGTDTPTKKGKSVNVEKAINTQKRQPPDMSDRGVSKDGKKLNIANLTDDELDALPASKLAEMRGDARV